MGALVLGACGHQFAVRCADADTLTLLHSVFGDLVAEGPRKLTPAREYRIDVAGSTPRFRLSTDDRSSQFDDIAHLIFHLDKDITIALQHLRPDLLFIHAAAVGCAKRVALLSASTGTGKSTLTLAALNRGLDYLSDELAPVDLDRLTVEAYPRSLFLKSPPPLPLRLPGHTIAQSGRYYVSYPSPRGSSEEGAQLAALIFLRRDDERFSGLRKITAASGAARVMANTLNLLAHPHAGLDAAIRLTRRVPCFELDATDLDQASAAIKTALVITAPISRINRQ